MDRADDIETEADGSACARHEHDIYAWALEQSEALRQGRMDDLDLPNLADEVGSLACREFGRLQGRLERLVHQLLLWDLAPGHRSDGRAATIAHQRRRVRHVLARCPSLEARRAEALAEAYVVGRYEALREDDRLPEAALPTANPYSWDDLMARGVAWPVGGGRTS